MFYRFLCVEYRKVQHWSLFSLCMLTCCISQRIPQFLDLHLLVILSFAVFHLCKIWVTFYTEKLAKNLFFFIRKMKSMVKTKMIVWFQKISIPPPRKIIGNSDGEGGFKGSNFQGVRGVHGKLFSKGWRMHVQNIESNVRSIWRAKTYLRTLFWNKSRYSWPLRWG